MIARWKLWLTLAGVVLAMVTVVAPARAQPDIENALSVEQVAKLGTRRYRHGSMISQVWFAPDQRIVSAGGQKIRVWNSDSGKLANQVRHAMYSQAFFDGDGRVLIAEPLKNGVKSHKFRVVDINTGEQVASWHSPRWVEKAAFGHDSDFAELGNLDQANAVGGNRPNGSR